MSGPIDLAAVRQAHSKFINANIRLQYEVLESAGRFADAHVRAFSRFKQRSGGDSLKVATQHQVVPKVGGYRLRVFSRKKHASFIEYGTKPHRIVARRAQALRFIARGGEVIFRKAVSHPGTPAFRFLYNAINAAARIAAQEFRARAATLASRF